MKLFHVVPACCWDAVNPKLVEAHEIGPNVNFSLALNQNTDWILDQSPFFSADTTIDDFFRIINLFSPQYVIIPDKLLDFKSTMYLFTKFFEVMSSLPFTLRKDPTWIGMLQGTSFAERMLICEFFLKHFGNFSKFIVGIPKYLDSPNILKNPEDMANLRLDFLEQFIKIYPEALIHCAGSNGVPEAKTLKQLKVKSVDTSLAYKYYKLPQGSLQNYIPPVASLNSLELSISEKPEFLKIVFQLGEIING